MDWGWYLLLIVVLLGGVAATALTLPGIWVMVAASVLYAWATGWQFIGLWTILCLVLLAVASEIVEFVAGGAGAKKAGGSRRAAWGAILGGLIGAIAGIFIPIPLVGSIIGACIGAFAGALMAEYTVEGHTARSLAVGWGAAKGRLWGIVSKLVFAVLILAVAMIAGLPLGGQRKAPATAPARMPSTTRVQP